MLPRPPAHRQRSHARSPSRREFPPAALCLLNAALWDCSLEGAALATQCPDSCLIESAKHDESVLAGYRRRTLLYCTVGRPAFAASHAAPRA